VVKLGLELAIMLTPHVNDGLSQEECRALAARFAELAARRAREAGALKPLRVGRCRGCTPRSTSTSTGLPSSAQPAPAASGRQVQTGNL